MPLTVDKSASADRHFLHKLIAESLKRCLIASCAEFFGAEECTPTPKILSAVGARTCLANFVENFEGMVDALRTACFSNRPAGVTQVYSIAWRSIGSASREFRAPSDFVVCLSLSNLASATIIWLEASFAVRGSAAPLIEQISWTIVVVLFAP